MIALDIETTCLCGCGKPVKKGNRFIHNHHWIGRCHSEETKLKTAEMNTGRHHTEKSKQKMSDSSKGKTPWNKGKPRSEKTKQKISKSHIGKTIPEKVKLKMSISRMKPRSDGYCDVWTVEYRDDLRKSSCEFCGITNMMSLHLFSALLCVHHANGKKNCSPKDIMTLCTSCHSKLHRKLERNHTRCL
jgi:hypothetical protein